MIYLIALLFFQATDQVNEFREALVLPDSSYVVVSLDTSSRRQMSFFPLNVKPFSPHQKEIDRTIAILDSTVMSFNEGPKDWTWSGGDLILENYYKQLVYGRSQSGDKLVWINCYNRAFHHPDYRESICVIKDGGKGVFCLVANLADGESRLHFSGR